MSKTKRTKTIAESMLENVDRQWLDDIVAMLKRTRRRHVFFGICGRTEEVTRAAALQMALEEVERRP